MNNKTKDPQQAPHENEQNSKTNIGYNNTPKKAKDTKGEDVKPAEHASVDMTQKQKQAKHSDKHAARH